MPTLTIRRVPDEDHERLKRRAAAHGRSVEQELRNLIHEAGLRLPKVDVEERKKRIAEIQSHWAHLRDRLSVDKYLEEKRAEVAADREL